VITKTSQLKEYYAGIGRIVVVAGNNGHWGRGKCGESAYNNAHKPKGWVAYDCADGTYVASDGVLSWNTDNLTDPDEKTLAEFMHSLLSKVEPGQPRKFFRQIGKKKGA
jgi:hypothetical protein